MINGIAQVGALEQALVSSQSALDSNSLGYEVGVRINIDVLNAQQQLFSTRRDLAVARYNTITNHLRLKAAAGSLREEDLEESQPRAGSPSSVAGRPRGAARSRRGARRRALLPASLIAPRAARSSAASAAASRIAAAGVGRLHRRARLEREARRLGEIEHVRPDDHRRAGGERLDQVLAAERRERAADHRDVAGGVIERHLAHRVAEMHAVAGAGQRLARCGANAAQLRHLVEALRMARHDDDQRALGRSRCLEQQLPLRLRACWRAAPPGAPSSRAPRAPGSELLGVGRRRRT